MDESERKRIEQGANDFRYVDKKKEIKGCLSYLGEETLGCVVRIIFAMILFGIIYGICHLIF